MNKKMNIHTIYKYKLKYIKWKKKFVTHNFLNIYNHIVFSHLNYRAEILTKKISTNISCYMRIIVKLVKHYIILVRIQVKINFRSFF